MQNLHQNLFKYDNSFAIYLSILIVLTFAAIITPPDVASQIIVAIPVMILYQISIFISRLVLKKQNR